MSVSVLLFWISFFLPQQWGFSWTLCHAKRWGHTPTGKSLIIIFWIYVTSFLLQQKNPNKQTWLPIPPVPQEFLWKSYRADLVLMSKQSWGAALLSHQSSLSRPFNQAKAAFSSSTYCWCNCRNGPDGLVEQVLSIVHVPLYLIFLTCLSLNICFDCQRCHGINCLTCLQTWGESGLYSLADL